MVKCRRRATVGNGTVANRGPVVPVGVCVAVIVGDDAFTVSAVPVALESVVPQQGTGLLRRHGARDVLQEKEARRVEAGTEKVPGIERTSQQRNRFHGPVKTQPPGTQKEPKVEGGEVKEGESSSQQRVAVRSWVIRRSKIWRLAAH